MAKEKKVTKKNVPAPGGATAGSLATAPASSMSVDEKLNLILKEVADLKVAGAEKDKKIALLEQVADKGRIDNIEKKKKRAITPIVRVSTYQGALVVAWRMLTNEVYKDERGVWHEDQIVEITLANGEKKQLAYVDFARLVERVPAEVVKREQSNKDDDFDEVKKTTTKKEVFTVKIVAPGPLKNKEVTIDGAFIN